MAEEAIRNSTVRFNDPVECWGCTNPPRHHADMFHTYRNCPNNRDPDVAERAKQSIQEYAQHNYMKEGIRGDQDSQVKCSQTSSMIVRYMFAERRVQLTQSWKEEGFGSLDHEILMCEMMDPYTSR